MTNPAETLAQSGTTFSDRPALRLGATTPAAIHEGD